MILSVKTRPAGLCPLVFDCCTVETTEYAIGVIRSLLYLDGHHVSNIQPHTLSWDPSNRYLR